MYGPKIEAPRANKSRDEIERRMRLLHAPHVVKLTQFVESLRKARGVDRVPYFDPMEAGVRARILLLLEAPGAKATVERGGSGFVSADNDDRTAENLWRALREAGINRATEVATWNVVPWYVGSNRRIRPVDSPDLLRSRQYLDELLELLTEVRVVVLLGRAAARGWARLGLDVATIECPHPSPQNLGPRPRLRSVIAQALCEAHRRAGR